VLQSTPRPGPRTNPYVSQLHESLRAAGVDVRPFSWRTALLGRYDVVHLHWPEILLGGSDTVRAAARRALTALFVVRLAVCRTPVVRTLHNLAPHEPVRGVAGVLLRALSRRESWWVRLNETTAVADVSRTTTVPHGHYRDWFAGVPTSACIPGRLVVPGLVRRYKGYEELLEAFPLVGRPDLSLHVVGAVQDEALRSVLQDAAERDSRISVDLRHVDDAELAAAVTAAQLVVLPYRHLQNSGTALLALSLDRPVLLPRTAASEALAHEVGAAWVLLTEVDDAAALAAGISRALARPLDPTDAHPDLTAREWSHGARLHLQAYRAAWLRRRARP
jgi:beta-1,4-mannosyltransferase